MTDARANKNTLCQQQDWTVNYFLFWSPQKIEPELLYTRFVMWTEPTIYHISCWVFHQHEGVKFPILTNHHWVTSWWSIGSFGYTSWLDKQLGKFRKIRAWSSFLLANNQKDNVIPFQLGRTVPTDLSHSPSTGPVMLPLSHMPKTFVVHSGK